MTDNPEIYSALSNVMKDVQAVGKDGYNAIQKFPFRGVDGVVNAVGPRLREHGVIVTPDVVDISYRDFNTAKGALMHECTVKVAYTFWASDGSSITCSAPGESADSGDKSTPKAMSVAYRTALLQALCIPTHEPDPDEETHERGELVPAGPPQASKAEKDDLFERMQAIPDADHRRKVKREFVANFGDLGTLPASDVDAASNWILNHEDVPTTMDHPGMEETQGIH